MVVYCFSFRGRPPVTNEFASSLCRYSRRARRRLLQVALRHRPGGQVALRHRPGGQVALLRITSGLVAFLRSRGTLAGQLALLRCPRGKVGKVLRRGRRLGKVGTVGVRHTLWTKVSSDGFPCAGLGLLDRWINL